MQAAKQVNRGEGVKTENMEPECRTDEHPASGKLPLDDAACDRAAAIFRALGDPNRLRILMLLQGGEMCVSAITNALGDNLSAVSQRLKLLRFERIVVSRREGKHIHYRMADLCISELVSHAVTHALEQSQPPVEAR